MVHSHYKAVVVGAGPVGAAMALSLAKLIQSDSISRSNRILLVDAAPQIPEYDPETPDIKIFALNAGSQSLLDELGVWNTIVETRSQPYTRMHVWDANGTGSIEFDSAQIGASQLGHIVEANLVQVALLKALDELSNVDILRPEKVTDLRYETNEAKLTLSLSSGESVEAELLCAADGANSSLRSMQNIEVAEKHVGQRAIVANLVHEHPHQDCAWQIFHSTGPLAFLPMADYQGKHLSSIVWSLDDDQAAVILAKSRLEFEKSLKRAMEEKFGQLELVTEPVSFPLSQRHAKQYIKPCFALLGDAAHSIHPLAGLGANIGFQDVKALTNELNRALNREILWSDEQVLKRYQRARKLDNEATLQAMQGFKTLFGQDDATVSSLRNLGLKLANSSDLVKRQFVRRAMMIGEPS